MPYTGMRVSDAFTFGPQHVKDEWIEKVQHKFRKRRGDLICIPMLPVLREIIDATPTGSEVFLTSNRGEPHSIESGSPLFATWCRRAGLSNCTAHGLRKVGAVNAAENGATDAQIKAIFGWEGSREVALYTAKRDRKKLAAQAMELIMHKGVKK